jgi:hypothetical protein
MACGEFVLDEGQYRDKNSSGGKDQEPEEPKEEKQKKTPALKVTILFHGLNLT